MGTDHDDLIKIEGQEPSGDSDDGHGPDHTVATAGGISSATLVKICEKV